MSDQFDLPLDGEAYARATDPVTSHEAAEATEGAVASRLEKKVLDCLHAHPDGLTGTELVIITGIPNESCTPRIRPLVNKGLVVDSGEKRVNPRSNKRCIVWKAVKKEQT